MRSNVLTITVALLLTGLAAAHAQTSAADYFDQDDPLPETTTVSGRALSQDTEVLTPKGILTEDAFTATQQLPAGNALLEGSVGAEGEGVGYGFDEEGSTVSPAAGPSTSYEAPQDALNPLMQPDAPDTDSASVRATPAMQPVPEYPQPGPDTPLANAFISQTLPLRPQGVEPVTGSATLTPGQPAGTPIAY